MRRVTATVAKIALRWRSNASFSFMLLFTQYKTTRLTTISSHCLAAFSTKDQNFRQEVFNRRFYVFAGGLDIVKINKTPLIYGVSYFNLGDLEHFCG